ncbi:MAG: TRZ/ATZ family hydrolase [Oleibacter sp.]|nr:TRZ/ATZ family hydrolase [Thalassolituus sp.]
MQADLCIHARWVLPMTGDEQILENHSVFIKDGRIVSVLSQEDSASLAQFSATETITLDQHALLPGYINAHGHAAMSLFRGLADDLPLMTWLQEHIWPAEGQWVDADFVHDGTQLAMAEMLKCGTTTFADMYFYSGDSVQAAIDAGMRTVAFTPILDFPTNFAKDADEYISKAMAVHQRYADEPLATIGLGPHAPYTVSDGPLKTITELSKKYQIPVQIHCHETAFEVEQSIELLGINPIKRLANLGFFNERVSCVHMTQLSADDIAIIKESGASIVHCPESNLKLASGFCPAAEILKAGITLALGTDGAASNNDLNLQGEMKTAAMLAKAVANNAAVLPAMQALRVATLGGAEALGIAHETGSIEVGKWADLQAVRLDGLAQTPMYDPASQLVYTDSSRYTEYTWVAGQALMAQGKLTTLDESLLCATATAWQTRIAQNQVN